VGLGRRPGPAGYVMLGSLPRVSSVVPACGFCLQSLSRCRKVGWCSKCGLVIADDNSALKGRPSKAQANGLGGSGKRIFHFRPQALKGRDNCESRRSALQGSTRETTSFPRPLAWALPGRPFGAVSCRRIPVASLKDRVNTHSGHYQKSRSHGVEELRSRSTESRELTAPLVLEPQARKVAAGSSTARLLDSSTPKFDERTGNIYENKGRGQKVKKSRS
jgi:hypothetical protein